MTARLRMTTAGVTALTRWWVLAAVLLTAAAVVGADADEPDGETWRGLVVAAEVDCTDYAPANFRHSQSVEKKIADNLGGWWSLSASSARRGVTAHRGGGSADERTTR